MFAFGRLLVAGLLLFYLPGELAGQTVAKIREIGSRATIHSLQFGPEGAVLVSAGRERSVRVWTFPEGKGFRELKGHKGWVLSLAFAPGKGSLASGGVDGSVRIWDLTSGAGKTLARSEDAVTRVAFDPRGRYLASGHVDGTISLWDVSSGMAAHTFAHPNGVAGLAFGPEGKVLASGGEDGIIRLWDVEKGTEARTMSGHRAGITSISFHPEGTYVASGSRDATVGVWDASDGTLVWSLEGHRETVYSVCVRPDGRYVVSGSRDNSVKAWDVETGEEIWSSEKFGADVYCVAFSPDGGYLAAGRGDSWKTRDENEAGIVLWEFDAPPEIEITEPVASRGVKVLAVSRISGRSVRVAGVVSDDRGVARVLVDGADASLSHPKPEPTGISAAFHADVRIGAQEMIRVVAIDTRGQRSEREIVLHREEIASPSEAFRGQRWAVIIGISDYRYSGPKLTNLRYADRDAEAFYRFLQTPHGGGFARDHMVFLKNKEATLQNIRDALFVFLKQAIEEDLVILYFAGHGAPEPDKPENLYLLTYDTDPERIASTAFPMWDIEIALDRHINSRRVVFFTDACHSAGVAGGVALRAGTAGDNLINRYLSQLATSGEGRAIFTASEAGEFSQESERWGGGHGVFTYHLLEGLKGAADMNDDGIVTLGEIMDYVDENVRRDTKSCQHPDSAGRFDRALPMAVVR